LLKLSGQTRVVGSYPDMLENWRRKTAGRAASQRQVPAAT
jgi:hypothetical protein